MPFLVLAVVGIVVLLLAEKPAAQAPTAATTPKPSPAGGGLVIPDAVKGIVGVAAAAAAGAEGGDALDKALYPDAQKTTADQVRHDTAIVGGAAIGASLALFALGYISGPVVFVVFVVCWVVYFSIAWLTNIFDGHHTFIDGVREFTTERDRMVKSVFDQLRPQPNLVGVPDISLYREVLPFVDGYMQAKDETSWRSALLSWQNPNVFDQVTNNATDADSALQLAQQVRDEWGMVIGTFNTAKLAGAGVDYFGAYQGIPRELRLSYGGSALDVEDKTGAWAAKYAPPSEQVQVVDSETVVNVRAS